MYVCVAGVTWYPQAEAQQADSVDVINAWASRVTKGLIQMAIPPGTPFDMVLTNAVYFKVTGTANEMQLDFCSWIRRFDMLAVIHKPAKAQVASQQTCVHRVNW